MTLRPIAAVTLITACGYEATALETARSFRESAYRKGQPIGIPKIGAMDCTMVAAAPVLPPGYVVGASRIADRRVILAGYRLADVLTRVSQNFD